MVYLSRYIRYELYCYQPYKYLFFLLSCIRKCEIKYLLFVVVVVEKLKLARITPVFNEGSRFDIDNYKPTLYHCSF